MDAIYVPSFTEQLNELFTAPPHDQIYTRIASMVELAEKKALPPGIVLRIDGKFFLILNMGTMIVIPWQKAQKKDFFSQYSTELQGDILDIVTEAKAIASQYNVSELSANLLLGVTASRRGGQRTRGINIWGP